MGSQKKESRLRFVVLLISKSNCFQVKQSTSLQLTVELRFMLFNRLTDLKAANLFKKKQYQIKMDNIGFVDCRSVQFQFYFTQSFVS